MNTIRITKEFSFEASHALDGYDGKCKNIHGHSYQLVVTIKGKPIEDVNNPKYGMVLDFGDLKKLIKEAILDKFDHSLILNETSRFKSLAVNNEKVILVPYQPTSEMMVIDFARRIRLVLPTKIRLHNLILRETATSYAEWHTNDNNKLWEAP
jgi:6-pyruvoyltetrahydropterin/6-carboxytetrahydropterin synthase